jgi:ABC-type antimicrobial peptide transport system permease subunit
MIVKDFRYAMRNLRKNKLLAAINVLGLSIGISSCLVIYLIASYELSFDKFQPEKEKIYRIYSSFSGAFTAINRGVPTGMAVKIREEFTGVESTTNFHNFGARVSVPDGRGGLKDFDSHKKIIIADPDYFKVFNYYHWIVGNPQQSLSEPHRVVLSESRARTYFGEMDPIQFIGKEVHYRDSLKVTVSGIVKDITEKTDLDFTDFISFSTVGTSWLKNEIIPNNWTGTNSSSQLFIKLASGTSSKKIEAQFPIIKEKYREYNSEAEWSHDLVMQPLADLHFNPAVGIFDSSRSVAEKSTLKILILVAVLLLIIASINFINLETAQSSRRAKEVGIRKVLGSTRRTLITRFLSESLILCILAVILSIGLASLAISSFSEYIPEGMTFDVGEPAIVMFLILCVLCVTLLAGFYPAFVISSYQPALALKDLARGNSGSSRSGLVRRILTVFQFSFSQILIIVTIAIGLQLDFMLDKDLGFEAEAILFVRTPGTEKPELRQSFQNELAQIAEIEMFSNHGEPPSSSSSSSSILTFDTGKELLKHDVYWKRGDTAYIALYGIELIAGRNVLMNDSASEMVINETYVRQLGFDQPRDVLGKTIEKKSTIVGVVKDFHTQSLHNNIRPTAIMYRSGQSGFGIKVAAVGGQLSNLKPTVDKIEKAWQKIYPDHKFEYTFVDESIKRFYENEQRTGKLASTATVIAILISCLGLFGLSSFSVVQRTKEIGIRKVLGATVNGVMFLLAKDFLKLVLAACIIATPFAYYLVEIWLKKFAFRMDLSAWIFVLSGLVSVIVAFITVSFRTVRAAQADPVKTLKNE